MYEVKKQLKKKLVPGFRRIRLLTNWRDPAGNWTVTQLKSLFLFKVETMAKICCVWGCATRYTAKGVGFFFIDFLQKKVNLSSGTCGWGG